MQLKLCNIRNKISLQHIRTYNLVILWFYCNI